MKKILLLLISISFSFLLSAQSVQKQDDDFGVLRQNELSFGAKLNTNGWSFFGTYGKSTGFYKSRFYQIEIIEFKSPKENRVSNNRAVTLSQTWGNNPKSYIYGKQNSFIGLHFSFGKRILIGDKAEKSGVSAEFVYQYGPTLGLLKPYYLDLIYTVQTDGIQKNVTRPRKYTEETHDRFLNRSYIYGTSGFSKGLDEMKLIPGAHGKAGLHFDWAPYNEIVRALEVGIGADLFIRNVPIMVNEGNDFYFLYLYLGIEFGKRW